jgi:hypothetical protein
MLVGPAICTLVRSYVNGVAFGALAGTLGFGDAGGRGRV